MRSLPTLAEVQAKPRDLSKGATPSRQLVKGRRQRAESKVEQAVRARCVVRDGDCRLQQAADVFGPCAGESEWAHLGEQKRARTRGMPPEQRHTTAGSLMLCTGHHRAYDAGRLTMIPKTAKGANGLLLVRDPRQKKLQRIINVPQAEVPKELT